MAGPEAQGAPGRRRPPKAPAEIAALAPAAGARRDDYLPAGVVVNDHQCGSLTAKQH
jgi:hypothetical protein